jgi:hypothetical protein
MMHIVPAAIPPSAVPPMAASPEEIPAAGMAPGFFRSLA